KGVAGARAVDTLDWKCRQVFHAFFSRQQRAVGAQRNNDAANAEAQKLFRALLGVLDVLHRHAGNRLGFALVGDEVVEAVNGLDVDRLAGGGIQDAPDSAFPRKGDRIVNRLQWNFELEHNAIDRFQKVGGSIDVGGLQFVVRAFDHEDAALSAGFDKYRRHTTGHTFHLLDVSGVDAELLEIFDGGRTEQIAANPRHHKDRGSAQFGCGRLIGALASESQIELLAEDGFAGLGKTVGKSGEINIGAAHHSNSRNFSHDSEDPADRFGSSHENAKVKKAESIERPGLCQRSRRNWFHSPYGTQIFFTWVARCRNQRPSPCCTSNQSMARPSLVNTCLRFPTE